MKSEEEALYHKLSDTIAENPSNLIRDGGVINAGFDAELDELRKLQNQADEFLLDLEAQEREKLNCILNLTNFSLTSFDDMSLTVKAIVGALFLF